MDVVGKVVNTLGNLVNAIYDPYTGGTLRPVFFDIEETRPELLILDKHFDIIREEFEAVKETYSIPAYEELDAFQTDASKPKTKWKVFMLNLMGEYPELAKELCPNTCEYLKGIPHLFEAFFSVLEPGRSIPHHEGPYRGYIRYHLGIEVPQKNPPAIRIKDQIYQWKERESVLFDDTWDHEVINHSEEERVVLIVDILRPMPPKPHRVNHFLVKNFIKPFYGRKLVRQNRKYFDKQKQD